MTLCNLSRFAWSIGSAALAALVLVGCLPSVVEKHVLVTVVVVEQVPVTVEVPVTVLVRDVSQSTAAPPRAGTATRLGASSSPVPADTRVDPTVYLVANTNDDGVYIRRSPDLADRIKAWPEDTPMIQIGPAVVVDYVKWRNVRDPDGNEGFVPSSYLLSERQAAARNNQPADTPRPQTAKPAPTRQSQAAGCTAATRRYIAQVEQASTGLNAELYTVGALILQMTNQPSLFFQSEWQAQLSKAAAAMNGPAIEIFLIDEPADPAAFRMYEQYLEFARNIGYAATSLTYGANNSDAAELEQGIGYLEKAQTYLNSGEAIRKRVCG